MAFDFAELRSHKDQARHEVFRFEWLRTYNVAGDIEEFERWKKGEPTAADDPTNDYYAGLRRLRERGVRQLRVRVADFPIHEYLRYEIDFYLGSQQHGEEIFLIERAAAVDCMQTTVVTGDYWLFDREEVLIFEYDEGGELRDQRWAAPDTVPQFTALRDCLVRRAMPLDDFMRRYAESFGAHPATT
jgi:hypothetical protein